MNQIKIERLRQERDLALNTAMGTAAERDAAYAAVTRANRECDLALAEVERIKKEAASSRRAGRAEGLREAAEVLRTAAAADARNAVYSTAPNHRERLQTLSENELVMAQRMLARAEEVERG